MPFIPIRRGAPFGTWLKLEAHDEDEDIAEFAVEYADDIAATATPRDVRDQLRFRQAPEDAYHILTRAVRSWLAETIPVDHRVEHDADLVAWPIYDWRFGIDPPVRNFAASSAARYNRARSPTWWKPNTPTRTTTCGDSRAAGARRSSRPGRVLWEAAQLLSQHPEPPEAH
jgi:hypothetical protein